LRQTKKKKDDDWDWVKQKRRPKATRALITQDKLKKATAGKGGRGQEGLSLSKQGKIKKRERKKHQGFKKDVKGPQAPIEGAPLIRRGKENMGNENSWNWQHAGISK